MSLNQSPRPTLRVLVTGGIRSGKSAHAEQLATQLAGGGPKIYLATGPTPDASDAEWAARIDAHRSRRDATWTSVEASDPIGALAAAASPVLLDDLGSWLVTAMDSANAWEGDHPNADVRGAIDAFVSAVDTCPAPTVLVTSEVGLTLVADNRAGRRYQDELGYLNQRMAEVCTRVDLVIAGCPLTMKDIA